MVAHVDEGEHRRRVESTGYIFHFSSRALLLNPRFLSSSMHPHEQKNGKKIIRGSNPTAGLAGPATRNARDDVVAIAQPSALASTDNPSNRSTASSSSSSPLCRAPQYYRL